jgi:hypothetical protein
VSAVAAIVALADLAVVQNITSAIRKNLIAAGGVPGPLGTIQMPKKHGRADGGDTVTINPEPRFEPRPVYHPTPRFEPRKVHHPDPVFKQPTTLAPLQPEQPSRQVSPLTPPWKEIPLLKTEVNAAVIKYQVARPDQIRKGSIIDVFL